MEIPPVVLESGSKPKDRYLRWFSSRAARRHRLASLGEAESVTITRTVVSNDGRLAFFKNSKAGCTSVAEAIYCYNYGTKIAHSVHSEHANLRQGPDHWEGNIEAIENGAVTFSFVRNPASRARSAFINFFIDCANGSADRHILPLKARGLFKKDDLSYRFDVFLSYIEESLQVNPNLTDRHWRYQVFNTGMTMFPVSFIGKLEDGLNQGLSKVGEISGCVIPRIEARKNASSPSNFTLSRSHVLKIEQLYEKDYETFSY